VVDVVKRWNQALRSEVRPATVLSLSDAIRATAADTEEDMADMVADKAMTRRALKLLGSKRNDAYEIALAHCAKTRKLGGRTHLPAMRMKLVRAKKSRLLTLRDYGASSKAR
jgi:hypothetical protein